VLKDSGFNYPWKYNGCEKFICKVRNKVSCIDRCAAKAFYSCPAIISRRPGSQNTPKEWQLNPEEDSRIKQARSHVTLEKSSKNYKPSEEW
jgi:hypothetical protein